MRLYIKLVFYKIRSFYYRLPNAEYLKYSFRKEISKYYF